MPPVRRSASTPRPNAIRHRWWLLPLFIAACAASVGAVRKCRSARGRHLLKVRTRIGLDLHDDIGSNLTRIAVLCESLREQVSGDAATDARLSSIGRISRESIAAMSDIIWAVNPQQDSLIDLVRRMRDHADQVLGSQDVELVFSAPEDGKMQLSLEMDLRREVLLIFKEAVTNASRHACCSRVAVSLHVDDRSLRLEVADDGIGFDASAAGHGNGIPSMRRRANRLSGQFHVQSTPGRGTCVRVRIPLRQTRNAPVMIGHLRRLLYFGGEKRLT